MKLIITRGLPGSGKTTWAKQFVLDNPDFIRINRDDIRNMLGKYWMPSREKLVTRIEIDIANVALMNGYSVVVDATNFKYDVWKEVLLTHQAQFEIKDFTNVPIEECISRDNLRTSGKVGEEVIRGMYKKYLEVKN